MLTLVDPHVRYRRSFLAAMGEHLAEGEDRYAERVWPADEGFPGVRYTAAAVRDHAAFAEMTAWLLAQRDPATPRPGHFVPTTELWVVEGEEFVGRISVRHRLTPSLLTWGGHVGYAVRPSARRRGVATFALRAVLPHCARLGIDPVLVTCDVDNAGSRRTIERAGGVYEDTREGKLRYCVPTPGGA